MRILVLALLIAACNLRPTAKSPAAVLVHDDGFAFCGAAAIEPRVLVTAAHCTDYGEVKELRYATDEQRRLFVNAFSNATLKRLDRARDLAWLDIAPDDPPLPSLTARSARTGEAAVAIGAAFGWHKSFGHVLRQDSGFLETDISIAPGWSGSPVIAGDGELIGIVSACTGYAIHVGTHTLKFCAPGSSFIASFGPIDDATAVTPNL
jgi:hypothetical protein